MCGLNQFIERKIKLGVCIGELSLKLVESFVELIDWKEVTDGDIGVLVVFGQLEDDVAGDFGTGTDDVKAHALLLLDLIIIIFVSKFTLNVDC